MQDISKYVEQVSSSINQEIKTDQLKQSMQQTSSAIKRWASLIIGLVLLGSLVLLTIQSGSVLIKEVLISTFIIACLLFLRGPGKSVQDNSGS